MENRLDRHDAAAEIAENLRAVQDRVNAACIRAGRDPQEVTLLAVSKMKPFSAVLAAYDAGARCFGENYVQELTDKIKQMEVIAQETPRRDIQWHMIGHLQKNKVKYLIGRVALIHSVDTLALAEQIEREAAKKDVIMDILMEVNVAEEASKWGFTMENAMEAAETISPLPHLRLLGLMTSAPYTENPESNRTHFRALRNLALEMKAAGLIANHPDLHSPVLSMGMSGDFEVAVEEGATMVRVGTSIFGERDYSAG